MAHAVKSQIFKLTVLCYNKCVATPYTGKEGRVVNCKEYLYLLFFSIMASVVAYYICKWLDRKK